MFGMFDGTDELPTLRELEEIWNLDFKGLPRPPENHQLSQLGERLGRLRCQMSAYRCLHAEGILDAVLGPIVGLQIPRQEVAKTVIGRLRCLLGELVNSADFPAAAVAAETAIKAFEVSINEALPLANLQTVSETDLGTAASAAEEALFVAYRGELQRVYSEAQQEFESAKAQFEGGVLQYCWKLDASELEVCRRISADMEAELPGLWSLSGDDGEDADEIESGPLAIADPVVASPQEIAAELLMFVLMLVDCGAKSLE